MAIEFGPKDRYRTYGVPSLDIPFADRKSLVDIISGNNLITFTRSTTGTYVGSDGLIKTAAVNEPRFDHNPLTRESLGLLVEEARTNRISWSFGRTLFARGFVTVSSFTGSLNIGEVFTSSNGGTFRLIRYSVGIAHFNSISGDQSLANVPLTSTFGTITAIVGGTANSTYNTTISDAAYINYAPPSIISILGNTIDIASGYWGFYAIGSKSAGTACICSVYIKVLDLSVDKIFLIQTGGGDGDSYRTYTISTGTFSSVSGNNAVQGVQILQNGWYRFYWGRSSMSSVSPQFIVSIQNSSGTQVNGGAYFDGGQVEEAYFPTSYIPTSGSTVTRAADVATVSNTNSSIYPTSNFTIINQPYGTSGGGTTLKLVGPTIKRTSVYSSDLSQTTINSLVNKTDQFWQWRVLGSSFALPNFTTNGSVTVDWGDGVVETLTTAAHTFTNGSGYHDVGFRLNSGTYFKPSNTNGNSTYGPRIIAIGPAPASMTVEGDIGFSGCSNLQGFDSTVKFLSGSILRSSWRDCSKLASFPLINTTGVTNFSAAWNNCTSLTSFPLINTASGTTFDTSWYNCASLTSFPEINTSSVGSFRSSWGSCTSLTSFPLINTSNGTDFTDTWYNCNKLVSFPALNLGNGTSFYSTWRFCSSLTSFAPTNLGKGTDFSSTWQGCSSLTSFPAIDASAGTIFPSTWQNCTSLTSFPDINMGAGTNFVYTWAGCYSLTSFLSTRMGKGTSFFGAWYGCSSLTSFPAINASAATTFIYTWSGCSSLATFPANVFNTTGILSTSAFTNAFLNCALTAQSIENILTSLVTNGQSGITLDLNGGINANTSTWSVAAKNAYITLVSRGWTITQNGTAPT